MLLPLAFKFSSSKRAISDESKQQQKKCFSFCVRALEMTFYWSISSSN